jgi:hypothetical protein
VLRDPFRTIPPLAAVLLALGARPVTTQQPEPPACADVPGFSTLDFWVGEWDVFVGDEKVGDNTIEKVLDGCAVTELWRSAGGGVGRSLFYYTPATDAWKQVWVTEQATAPGGVKEKTLIERYDDGGVRFQGVIALPDGRTYLDRTTLTPLGDGRVRQHIEVSTDGAQTWRTTFDAVYVRH